MESITPKIVKCIYTQYPLFAEALRTNTHTKYMTSEKQET